MQSSVDGAQYSKIGYVPADEKAGGNYNFTNAANRSTGAMYRINVVYTDATSKPSNAILITTASQEELTVGPNPGKGHFTISGSSRADIILKVISPDGKLIGSSKGSTAILSSYLNTLLQARSHGLYVLQLTSGTASQTVKLLVQQ